MDGKRLKEAKKGIDRNKLYTIEQAVKFVKERAKAKFDETIEIAMNLGVDPRHADQMVRGVCALPNGTGRVSRVAVFARGASEFWVCDRKGNIEFFSRRGSLAKSRLCPRFPSRIAV